MTETNQLNTYTHLARLSLLHSEVLTSAGIIPVQLLASIHCEVPSYITHDNITTRFASAEPTAITAAIIPVIAGQNRLERIKSLLAFLQTRRSPHWAEQNTIIVLCPAFAESAVRHCLTETTAELTIAHSLSDALTALNETAHQTQEKIALLTVDSLIDLAEFELNNSPLCHDLNPEGLIPSEGISVIYFGQAQKPGEAVVLNNEPFYKRAESEPTQALTQLHKTFGEKPEVLLSNHEASQNRVHEWYRFHHETTAPEQEPIQVTSIRNTLGDTGLNELGLLLALTNSQATLTQKPTAMVLFMQHQRMIWPIAPTAKGFKDE